MLQEFVYTVSSAKTVEQAVEAVKDHAEKVGFRVLQVHDVAATLAQKGFDREPLQMVELCHAPSLNRILNTDLTVSYFTPCKVNVYVQNGKVFVGTLRPTMMSQFFPGADFAAIAETVDASLRQIVDASR